MSVLLSFVFTSLIGWPALKLISTAISRRRWDRQRALRADLEIDTKYGSLERRVVAEKFEEGRGSLGQLALPFVALFGGLAVVFAPVRKQLLETDTSEEAADLRRKFLQLSYPEATQATFRLLDDDRFRALDRGATDLAMLRYPVASIMTGVAILPCLLILAIVHGLRLSGGSVARRIIDGSQQTVRTFVAMLSGSIAA